MKISLLLLLLVITWCLIDDSEGGRNKYKKKTKTKQKSKHVRSVLCGIKCVKACPLCTPTCDRKRSEECRRLSLPCLPCGFAAWDRNGDGHVDMKEFSSTAYSVVEEGDMALAFQAADTDGNQRIWKGELYKAAFLFEKC